MTTVADSVDLARPAPRGELGRYEPPPVTRLSTLNRDGLDTSPARVLPLATLSLGEKVVRKRQDGSEYETPRATRREDKQWFKVQEPFGEAPGLRAALEAGGWKHLTVAFGTDDPREVRSQLFTRYKSTGQVGKMSTLEAWGDHTGLKVIYTHDQKTGSPLAKPHLMLLDPNSDSPRIRDEYARQIASCAVETRYYFTLGVWEVREGRPIFNLIYPDGYGFYAFKTGSDPTVAALDGYIQQVLERTGGKLKDVPLEFEVFFLKRHSGDGMPHEVPSVKLSLRPPAGILVDARELRHFIISGLAQGRQLEMPSLPSPDVLLLESGVGVPEMTDEQAARLQAGEFPCDYGLTLRTFMAIINGTPLAADDGHGWLREWSELALGPERVMTSRTQFRDLTYLEAQAMLANLAEGIADVRNPPPEENPPPGPQRPAKAAPNQSSNAAPAPQAAPAKGGAARGKTYDEVFGRDEEPAARSAGASSHRAAAASKPEIVQEDAAVAAARPADQSGPDVNEEDEAELLALANADRSSTSEASDTPPLSDQDEPSELIRGPNTPEGRAYQRQMELAIAKNVPTHAFTIRYPLPRAEIVQKTMALARLMVAVEQASDPRGVGSPQSAAQSSDEDQSDLPF